MVFGTVTGVVIVDIMQKTCLLNMGTPDLYGSCDPYQRTPRSPKKTKSQGLGDIVEQCMADPERCRSQSSSASGMQEQVCGLYIGYLYMNQDKQSNGHGLGKDHNKSQKLFKMISKK